MTKLDLQKELLEKVKPGMKPSDIKRQVKPSPKPVSRDEGYESDSSDKSVPVASPLPNQNLLNQIKALQRQIQVYQDFKEADLKIKEKYKQEITERKKTIAELKSQANPVANIKHEEPISPKQYLFTCDICEQTKKSQLHLGKVNGLGIDPNKENKICSSCLRKVDLIQPPKEDFF